MLLAPLDSSPDHPHLPVIIKQQQQQQQHRVSSPQVVLVMRAGPLNVSRPTLSHTRPRALPSTTQPTGTRAEQLFGRRQLSLCFSKSPPPHHEFQTNCTMSRIYIGNLPTDIRESELDKLFGKFGRIRNITIKVKFAFLEFEDSRDADDAIHEMDRVNFGGYSLQVERARGGRESRDDGPRGGGGGGGGGGRGQYRVEASRIWTTTCRVLCSHAYSAPTWISAPAGRTSRFPIASSFVFCCFCSQLLPCVRTTLVSAAASSSLTYSPAEAESACAGR
jgi:hypothetical protein